MENTLAKQAFNKLQFDCVDSVVTVLSVSKAGIRHRLGKRELYADQTA